MFFAKTLPHIYRKFMTAAAVVSILTLGKGE